MKNKVDNNRNELSSSVLNTSRLDDVVVKPETERHVRLNHQVCDGTTANILVGITLNITIESLEVHRHITFEKISADVVNE